MVLLLLNNLYQQNLPLSTTSSLKLLSRKTFKIRHENKDTFSETVSNKLTLKVYHMQLLEAN